MWHLEGERWENGFRHLLDYMTVHGDSLVVQCYTCEDEFPLGSWVNFQRLRFRKETLEPERAERLSSLPGWVWNASDAKWEVGLQHLARFASEHQHVQVPIGYEVEGFKLRTWYANQRAKFDKFSPERQRRLNALSGWDDYSHDVRWEKAFRLLEAYVKEYGNARVERFYVVDGYPLGTWAP